MSVLNTHGEAVGDLIVYDTRKTAGTLCRLSELAPTREDVVLVSELMIQSGTILILPRYGLRAIQGVPIRRWRYVGI